MINITNINGRISDVFDYLKKDQSIGSTHSEVISHSLKYFKDIHSFQCILRKGIIDELIIESTLNEDQENIIRKGVKGKILAHINDIDVDKIKISLTSRIERLQSGKIKVIIRK